MFRLEARGEVSRSMTYLAPIFAVLLTLLAGPILFAMLGTDPISALFVFFIQPLTTWYDFTEVLVKAAPLVLIGVGLSFGFRAGVWNIGAEGQFTAGALAGSIVALAFYEVESPLLFPAMLIAGVMGGMIWAAVPAFLRTKMNTNEILTSLMLTYVALLLLSVLIHGPLKDPDGMNFPESRIFHDSATVPILVAETRLHLGWLIAIIAVIVAWIVLARHVLGFQFRLTGMAPLAARYAGFSGQRVVWYSFMISGGCAGLAGILEVAGPIGQVVPAISPGYGFTAIIVAFLGRLHPVGILLAGFVMALSYIGGETAQIELNLPNAVTGVFQGMLLFFLLAADVLVKFRIRFGAAAKA